MATETDNPGAAIAVNLNNFRIERIEVDLAPISIASCPQGDLLSDRQGKIALIDGNSHDVRHFQIPLSAGFSVSATATSDTRLLVAAAAGGESHLQNFSLKQFEDDSTL